MNCPRCHTEIQQSWKVCPFCCEGLHPQFTNSANIDVQNAAAREIEQNVAGGPASVEAVDAVVGRIEQKVAGVPSPDETPSGIEALQNFAAINVRDGVVKEIRQELHLHLGDAECVEALLGQTAARQLKARLVFVACGRKVLAYNPNSATDAPANSYVLPADMGSVRSVRVSTMGGRLLILAGARCGVVAFEQETGKAQVFGLPSSTRFGANAATAHDDHLYATHSDFGLLRWPLAGGEPTSLFPDIFEAASAVRGVRTDLHGQLLLCADSSVYSIDTGSADARPAQYRAPDAGSLVGAVECGGYLYAASRDGQILRWDKKMPGPPDMAIANMRCSTYCLSLVQMREGPHLVIGAKVGHLRLIKLAPPQATYQYCITGGSVARWTRGAPDLLVATDRSCGRLFFWAPDDVHRPVREITVPKSPKEQIMDICILSM